MPPQKLHGLFIVILVKISTWVQLHQRAVLKQVRKHLLCLFFILKLSHDLIRGRSLKAGRRIRLYHGLAHIGMLVRILGREASRRTVLPDALMIPRFNSSFKSTSPFLASFR